MGSHSLSFHCWCEMSFYPFFLPVFFYVQNRLTLKYTNM